MPRLDGYTAVDWIRHDELLHDTPILMVSAAGFPLNITLAKQLGARGFITKPFTSDELLNEIKKQLPEN